MKVIPIWIVLIYSLIIVHNSKAQQSLFSDFELINSTGAFNPNISSIDEYYYYNGVECLEKKSEFTYSADFDTVLKENTVYPPCLDQPEKSGHEQIIFKQDDQPIEIVTICGIGPAYCKREYYFKYDESGLLKGFDYSFRNDLSMHDYSAIFQYITPDSIVFKNVDGNDGYFINKENRLIQFIYNADGYHIRHILEDTNFGEYLRRHRFHYLKQSKTEKWIPDNEVWQVQRMDSLMWEADTLIQYSITYDSDSVPIYNTRQEYIFDEGKPHKHFNYSLDDSIGWKPYSVRYFNYSESTNIETEDDVNGFSLSQNYPNPFNPNTRISYSIQLAGPVHLEVVNMLGQHVATLVDEYKSAGRYAVEFEASHLSNGVYFYTIQSHNFQLTKKMLLVK